MKDQNASFFQDEIAMLEHQCIKYIDVKGDHRLIGLVGRVFTNVLVDLGSIPGRVIPKALKMVIDTSMVDTQQYKVCIEGRVEQSRERSSALPYTSV